MGFNIYPLNIRTLDTVSFTIQPLTAVSAKITAIRVQDTARSVWYNWDNDVWDANGQPYITPGANLYIAAYATNLGSEAGNIILSIKSNNVDLVAPKIESVAPNGTIGLETGTINMPASALNIVINAAP